jgi:hypothetical protein
MKTTEEKFLIMLSYEFNYQGMGEPLKHFCGKFQIKTLFDLFYLHYYYTEELALVAGKNAFNSITNIVLGIEFDMNSFNLIRDEYLKTYDIKHMNFIKYVKIK